MANNDYKKYEEKLSKRFVKGTKIFLKKKKTKSANMLVSDTEVNMVVNDIRIF